MHTNAGKSNHWICTSRRGGSIVHVMDSLGLFMSLNLFTVLQIAKIYSLPKSQSVLQLHKISVQQQHGTLDCGLFAIAYAVEVWVESHNVLPLSRKKCVSISMLVLQKECLLPFQKCLTVKCYPVQLLWCTRFSFTASAECPRNMMKI